VFVKTAAAKLSLPATDWRGATLDDTILSALKQPEGAAFDPEIAKRLRFSSAKNAENVAAIDRSVT
jgi:hypothetical protein